MTRLLSQLTATVSILESHGPDDLAIEGLAYDSREVGSGYLFFALEGLHIDGHEYIASAIAAGARAIVHSRAIIEFVEGVAYRRVENPRTSMSPIAEAFWNYPSREIAVIGVTGTEGKSTTVYLLYQLLRLAGKKAGFFSTVMSDTGGGEMPNPEHQTTPEATSVQRMLRLMRSSGMDYAIVEASSHGLSPKLNRLGGTEFDVGVFTNVTHEHLEFHGSFAQYRDDKANLFRALTKASHGKELASGVSAPPRFGVVNADDPSADYFRAAAGVPVFSFSARGAEADLAARDIHVDRHGESLTIVERAPGGAVKIHEARINLPGAFNVANTLASLLVVARIASISVADLVPLLPHLRPVRGRMTGIDRGQDFEVVVDYAHTPSSFETVFPPLRDRISGKMICVFGSGGERDRAKRPMQGRIAADFFDIVILADEDPRGEDPIDLLEEIAAGCPELKRGERLFLIPDRPSAIRKAFSLASTGDLVALLGKSHENSIIGKNGPIPYDEILEAERALGEMGWRRVGREDDTAMEKG